MPPDGAYPLSVACPPPGGVAGFARHLRGPSEAPPRPFRDTPENTLGFRGAHAGSEAAMVEAAMAAAAAAAGQNPAAAAARLP